MQHQMQTIHSQPETPMFPNAELRERLQSFGMGRLLHQDVCLRAMVERGTGTQFVHSRSPDQLAQMVLALLEKETQPQPQRI